MWITIDHESQLTLARQIYQKIREMILNGDLEAEHKLPSTRRLSAELSVSRNTVIEAYNQLIAEGYLESGGGSGTWVTKGLHTLDHSPAPLPHPSPRDDNSLQPDNMIDFRTGIPALEHFPRREWAALYRETCQQLPASAFGYCKASGIWELRSEISRYLYRTRGLSCHPDQIVITSGSTQGLSLISHILHDDFKTVLMEDPTHTGLQKVVSLAGCRIESIPVDRKGICTELLPGRKPVSFIYTTPSHQYPTGSILPAARRLELVRYAVQNNCYIVEDDYDSEFRYEGSPVSSLHELNPQRVIYLGSFSKILAPALRLGFMILPPELLIACETQKMYSDVHSDSLGQYTLARFIQTGGLEKYIWKMKKYYGRNRNLLLHELSRHFAGQFEVLGQSTGLHMVVQFHNKIFTGDIVRKIRDHGVHIYPLSNFCTKKEPVHDNKIILGYSHLSPEQIIKGIEIISTMI